MGSDVGQIFPTASLHRDHSISYALVCEKELSHIGKINGNPDLVCKKRTSCVFLMVQRVSLLYMVVPLSGHTLVLFCMEISDMWFDYVAF